MTADKRTGWLAELRQGDEVGVLRLRRYTLDHNEYTIGTVAKVTPSGRFTVGDWDYSPDGSVRGRDIRYDHDRRLVPLDEARVWVLHAGALLGLQRQAAELAQLVGRPSSRKLTTSAAQQLTVQIGALAEAVRVALGNETPPSAAGGDQ